MDVIILLSFFKENKLHSSATTSLNEKFKYEKKMLPFVFPCKVYELRSDKYLDNVMHYEFSSCVSSCRIHVAPINKIMGFKMV